jgi:hypothetical protein
MKLTNCASEPVKFRCDSCKRAMIATFLGEVTTLQRLITSWSGQLVQSDTAAIKDY